ncbi:C2 domain [Trinorchestia longiramus]|nr:C2 domain [Trinorchestia longiramus]
MVVLVTHGGDASSYSDFIALLDFLVQGCLGNTAYEYLLKAVDFPDVLLAPAHSTRVKLDSVAILVRAALQVVAAACRTCGRMLFSSEAPVFVKDGASVFMGMVATSAVLLFLVFLYLNRRVSLSLSDASVSLNSSHSFNKDGTSSNYENGTSSEDQQYDRGRPRCTEPRCPECWTGSLQNEAFRGKAMEGRPKMEDAAIGRPQLARTACRAGRVGTSGAVGLERPAGRMGIEGTNGRGCLEGNVGRAGMGSPQISERVESSVDDTQGRGGRVSPLVRSNQPRPGRTPTATNQASVARPSVEDEVHYGRSYDGASNRSSGAALSTAHHLERSPVPYHTPPAPHRHCLSSHHHAMPRLDDPHAVNRDFNPNSNLNHNEFINYNVRFSTNPNEIIGSDKETNFEEGKHNSVDQNMDNREIFDSHSTDNGGNSNRLSSGNDNGNKNVNYGNGIHPHRPLQRVPSYDPTMTRARPNLQYPYYSSLHEPEHTNLNDEIRVGNRKDFNRTGGLTETKSDDFHKPQEMSQSNLDHQHHLLHHHHPHHQMSGRSSPATVTVDRPELAQPSTSTGAMTGGLGGSSSASSSASTTSGDDELLAHRSLRHRDPKGYRGLRGNNRSPCLQGRDDAMFPRVSSSLEVSFAYDQPTRILTVHVLQAKEVPERESGAASNSQVRIMLVPNRRQKHKTRIRQGSNPQFNEAFIFRKISPEEVMGLALRFRLYECQRMRRERMLGEAVVSLSSVNLNMANSLWLTLEPRASGMTAADELAEVCSLPRSDSTGSNHSVHGAAPGLLVGLTYNGTTGRLAVEIIKGSHFRTSEDCNSSSVGNPRAPDSIVKIRLTSSSGQEIATAKTTIRRGQPNPLFKETFMFQVALFQLPDVTLLIAVYARKSMKRKDMIGWCSLGLSSSGEEELSHWNAMRDSKGGQTCRWHSLLVN